MDKPKKPKPNVRKNSEKGKFLHNSLMSSSKGVRNASVAFASQSKKLSDTIDKATEAEELSLSNIEKSLRELNKSAADFKEKEELLSTLKKESEQKSETLHKLNNTLDISSKLTETLLSDLNENSGSNNQEDLIVDQLANLSSIAKHIEAMGYEVSFDRNGLLEKFEEVLNEKALKKIQDKLNRLDNYFLNPIKNAGLFSNITDMLAASVLGPLGKPVADILNASNKVESKTESLLKRALGLEKSAEDSKKDYLSLQEKIDQSSLSKEDKDLIKKQLSNENEREQEIEIDRTQDFRAATLNLQRKNLENTQDGNFGIMQILSVLTGGKLVGALATAVGGLLGAKGLSKLTGIKNLASGIAKSIPKISPATRAAMGKGGAYGAAAAVAWEASQVAGSMINKKFDNEISDAVWWALEEAPEQVKTTFLKAKEDAATSILNTATSSYNKFSEIRSDSFNFLTDIKNNLSKELIDKIMPFNVDSRNYRTQQIQRLQNNINTTTRSNRTIYNLPSVEKFTKPSPQSIIVVPNKEKEQTKTNTQAPSLGKISMDDIPMYTDDDGLLLLTTGSMK